MHPVSLDLKTKGWLISSIFVLLINLVVFVFRKYSDKTLVLWVVLLTPVAWLILYLLFKRLFSLH